VWRRPRWQLRRLLPVAFLAHGLMVFADLQLALRPAVNVGSR
jgi:hypothetical protein